MDIGDISIKVSSQVLKNVSDDARSKLIKTKNAYEELDGVLKKTASYWEGAGQENMLRAYNIREDDYDRLFASINGHISKLEEIAGIYEAAEETTISVADILPGDIIS